MVIFIICIKLQSFPVALLEKDTSFKSAKNDSKIKYSHKRWNSLDLKENVFKVNISVLCEFYF